MIIGCSTLHSLEEFKELSDVFSSSTINYDALQHGDTTFLYPNIIDYNSKHVSSRDLLLRTIAMKFPPIPGLISIDINLAETTLLALLTIVNGMINLYPVHINLAKELIKRIEPFIYWPKPYATSANLLLNKLKAEAISPGYNIRRSAYSELLTINHYDEINQQMISTIHMFSAEPNHAVSILMGVGDIDNSTTKKQYQSVKDILYQYY